MAYDTISDAEVDYRSPMTNELHEKYQNRDNANFETSFLLEMVEAGTTAGSWADLSNQIAIFVPEGTKYLNIGAQVKGTFTGDPGTGGTAYLRFRIGTTYSTVGSVTRINPGTGTEEVNLKLDVSALSGVQTLYMQGYVTYDGDTGTMYGSILERNDTFISLE